MNVKIIRLLTGDDIIGEVVDGVITSETTLRNPMLIGVTPDQTLATAPVSLVAKTDEITISNSHILFTADPEDDILNAYKGKYGGIVTPKGIALP